MPNKPNQKKTHVYANENMQRNDSCFNPISRRVSVKLGYCLLAINEDSFKLLR